MALRIDGTRIEAPVAVFSPRGVDLDGDGRPELWTTDDVYAIDECALVPLMGGSVADALGAGAVAPPMLDVCGPGGEPVLGFGQDRLVLRLSTDEGGSPGPSRSHAGR